jgi:hypothetical protein
MSPKIGIYIIAIIAGIALITGIGLVYQAKQIKTSKTEQSITTTTEQTTAKPADQTSESNLPAKNTGSTTQESVSPEKSGTTKKEQVIGESKAPKLLPEDVIKMDIAAQNNHDVQLYLDIRTTKVGPPENKNEVKSLMEKYPDVNIFQNVETAKLVGIKNIPLSYSLYAGLTSSLPEYRELYSDFRTYYVAIDYKLKQEKRHFYNGVNYTLYVLGLENGEWKIVSVSVMPVHMIIEAGYGFGTPEEQTALEIQKEW